MFLPVRSIPGLAQRFLPSQGASGPGGHTPHGELVEAGYDAAVRLGELIDQDMLAIPVSGQQR